MNVYLIALFLPFTFMVEYDHQNFKRAEKILEQAGCLAVPAITVGKTGLCGQHTKLVCRRLYDSHFSLHFEKLPPIHVLSKYIIKHFGKSIPSASIYSIGMWKDYGNKFSCWVMIKYHEKVLSMYAEYSSHTNYDVHARQCTFLFLKDMLSIGVPKTVVEGWIKIHE